ncbi:hypothetical protein B0J11DRAFT_536744 [Dendryphion nanum]|uniref:Peroxin 11C n=1 Tax=Dendryphion nanum TaxID=256645 RepID=A0A9P9IFT5_9PLEO|nr:hypothetical protein B0J11DRAFT_536744 [Dendryphion nanum]
MSDNTSEPGAPTAKGAAESSERVASTQVSRPNSVLSAAKQIDHTILRLNKLLASPGGLSAFLSTFNYSLYLLAYIQTKSPAIANHARKLLALVKQQPFKPETVTLVAAGATPSLATLAVIISRARTTLRLFGLFPLYAWLRTLLAGAKPGADPVLHRIALTQCLSYFTYQALENICFLTDNGVLSPRVVALLNRGESTTARVYLWAYRAWLGGVSCDFLRLAREAQLENRRRVVRANLQSQGKAVAEYQDEEDKKFDSRWWTDIMIASAWMPMALHFSSGTTGLPGWNLGWMGICGLFAGSSRAQGLWRATLHP